VILSRPGMTLLGVNVISSSRVCKGILTYYGKMDLALKVRLVTKLHKYL